MKITRLYRFEAAHRLVSPKLSDQDNWRVYGKCSRQGGHGHNYEVEVTLEGDPDPRSGMLMPRHQMDQRVREHLVAKVDHRDLNTVVDEITTGENLAMVFFQWLRPAFGDGPRLSRVRVHETARNVFEFTEG